MLSEHEAFSRLIDSLKMAESSARAVGQHRSDRRWDKIAGLLKEFQDKCYELAMRKEVETRQ